MTDRIKNTANPFAQGDAKELQRRIADLMPKDTRTEEEIRLFNEARERRAAAYQEARYGDLPANTYRILEQGSFVGWYYELEVGGNVYTLARPDEREFALFGDGEEAMRLAREQIAKLIGDASAEKAQFRFLFGGQL